MSNKELPIMFFAKRKQDNQRVEGGGSDNFPKWILSLEEAQIRADRLKSELNQLEEMFDKEEYSFIPKVIKSKITEDARAKTHRKEIRKIFNTNTDNLIGLDGDDEILVKVKSKKDFDNIKENLNQVEKNIYAISCIDQIKLAVPKVKVDKKAESYKIKLIDYQDYELNNAVKVMFESICKKKNIKYIKTEYTNELTIFKINNLTLDSLQLIEQEQIYNSIFSIEPMPKYRVSLDELNQEGMIPIKSTDNANKNIMVGVLDSGIQKIPHLKDWIVNDSYTSYPEQSMDRKHGTFVSGIINYGDDLEGKNYIGKEAFYLFDATIFPDPKVESIDEDELINNIKEAVKYAKDKVKIWNLSCGTSEECEEDVFSDFGMALDQLQDEYNVLICKSAGNCTNFMERKPKSKIAKSADSTRAIVVGSIAHSKSKYDLAEINYPSPFTRIGRGPQFIIKPDLVHVGGNAGIKPDGSLSMTGVKSFGIDGSINTSVGTSFSTPRITSLAAGLYSSMKEDFDPLLLKALIIHSCKYPENIQMPTEEIINQYGYGIPDSVNDILFNSNNEATLIMRDNISKSEYIDIFQFPMPDCLIEKGFYKGQIIATLVYNPILDPSQGGEYCQSNLDLAIGTYSNLKERDIERINILNPIGREDSQNLLRASNYSKVKMKENTNFLKERTLIEYGDKFYPVKKYAVDLLEFTTGNKEKYLKSDRKWYLKIDGVFRDFTERKALRNGELLNQEFCLILTIRDPDGNEKVYDQVNNKLDEYNFWHNNISIRQDIHLHQEI